MVTIAKNEAYIMQEFLGESTDEKPTGIFNGKQVSVNSTFLELDTGDLYYYNGSEWKKVGG